MKSNFFSVKILLIGAWSNIKDNKNHDDVVRDYWKTFYIRLDTIYIHMTYTTRVKIWTLKNKIYMEAAGCVWFFPEAEKIISNHLLHFSYKYLHASVSRLYLGTYSLSTYISNIVKQLKRRSSFCTRKLFKLGNLSKMFSVSLSTKNSHEIWFCAMTIYNNILVLYSKKSAIFFQIKSKWESPP